MAATTTLLGLVTPTQGTLSGTWGDTVNYGISDYVDISVAGTLTLTNDGAVTLANTTGSSSGNNITSTLTGAGTVTAQFAIVRVTGTLTVAKVVTGPSYSKTYTVVNAATGGIVTFKASGQTGVSVAVGESAFVYFNGTDYVKIVGTATAGAAGGSTTQVQFNSSGVLAGSANLTFDGTNLTVGGSATATRFIPSGATVATNGMYLPAANSLGLSTNSTNAIYIDSGQRIGIGGSPSSGSTVWNIKSITGSTTSIAYDAVGTVMSDVTSSASGYRTSISTTASAFTLSSLNHFSANQSTIGASSAVTNQIGFNVGSSLIGATNNYGFYGAIASGTNRYNLYMAGTADNYLAGSLGIGTTPTAGNTLLISKNMTGATSAFGTQNTSTIQSDVTSAAYIYSSQPSTQAASFTLSNLIHFTASQGTIGASSTVTNQFGFFVNSPMTGATNNYGFYGNLASGTGRWNFYAAGTAQNYFNGATGFGITPPASPGVSQIFSNLDISMAGSSRGILGNLYYQAAWKFVADGYGWAIADSSGALTFSLAGLNSSGAGAAATPVERLRILANGAIGLSGTNYGTSGQVLTSGGSGAAPTWTTVSGGGSPATPTVAGIVLGSTGTGSNAFGGYNAGVANTSGTQNAAFGSGAFSTNTTGSANAAFGSDALRLSTGDDNTAVGARALYTNSTGSQQTAVGRLALYLNTTGTGNTAVGQSSLQANLTGNYNVAMGVAALTSNTASDNTAVGYQALYSSTTAADNCSFGKSSGYGVTTGNNNVFVGNSAGYQTNIITTGIKNVILGAYSSASAAAGSSQVVIGWNLMGKGDNTGFIGGSSGVYNQGNTTTFTTTSDQRLKKNIADNNIGLDAITSIRVRNFEYRVEEEITELPTHCAIKKEGIQLGVIAQELQAVLPDCVKQESTGVLSVDTDNLTWYLINAIKELSARVKQLEGN